MGVLVSHTVLLKNADAASESGKFSPVATYTVSTVPVGMSALLMSAAVSYRVAPATWVTGPSV